MDARQESQMPRRATHGLLDAMHDHHLGALRRRADQFDGEARRLLEERLAALTAGAASSSGNPREDTAPSRQGDSPRSALGHLVDLLDARGANPAGEPAAATAGKGADAQAGSDVGVGAPPDTGARRDLDAIEDLRRIWSEVRTRSQVRQSLRQAPSNAGPLNSGSLVHRALTLMRDASPGYLRHFMAYLDALACLEDLRGPAVPAQAATAVRRSAPRPEPRPRAKAKPKPRPRPRKSKRLIARPESPDT